MRKKLIIALLCYCVLVLTGCVCLKQGVKGFLGISTKELENAKDKAIVKIVDFDYRSCYQKIEDRLTDIGSYIYAKRYNLIAVYISQTDTTPVGVFFKEIDKQKTELSIVSPATDTKEYLAGKIFSLF